MPLHEIHWYDWGLWQGKKYMIAEINWYDWVYYPMVRDALGRGRAGLHSTATPCMRSIGMTGVSKIKYFFAP